MLELRVPDMIAPQSQRNEQPEGFWQKLTHLPLLRIIILVFVLLALITGAIIAIINNNLDQQHITVASLAWIKPTSTILLSIVAPMLAILLTVLQWLFPISSSPPTTPNVVVVQSPQGQPGQMVFRNIITAPLNTAQNVQRREGLVAEVYLMLTRTDALTNVVILTGVSGVGKSTLAALLYYHTETQRSNSNAPFTGETLWLQITSGTTVLDIASTLFKAFGAVLPEDFSQCMPCYQAVLLFNLLNASGNRRLIILDQFDLLLDNHTGQLLPENQSISEWLVLLNSRASLCRILLTSCLWPDCVHVNQYIAEYPVRGFDGVEGAEFLRNNNVQGTVEELQGIVKQCDGNAFALTELAAIIQRHKLNLSVFFNNVPYVQNWVADIMRERLEGIVKSLDTPQYKLLLAFSVYRRPVPLQAVESLGQLSFEVAKVAEVATTPVLTVLDTLLKQNVMYVTPDGNYAVHTVIAEYIRNTFSGRNERNMPQLIRSAHVKAAKYYLQQTCLPKSQRSRIEDIEPLLEACWHFCQADLCQEAYNVALQEGIVSSLKDWGEYDALLELYRLLLSSDQWSQKYLYLATIWQDMSAVYTALGRTEDARRYLEKVNALNGSIHNG